ncbi:LPS export ABC transporter permease LptF [Limnobacter humi]|uniref:Lipopolysaccharide export system permease protein LptF n=1 Tax=Limnobacter humi TaxID=1778671 RepID=A0ABT1WHC1_9BURK|nr:LPS export ABC transporter permease LptF [Limnobacter humi]MCQ8896925.1 LPS export ABC transporter permease LptF [Limnobacter humi]
MLFRSSFRKDFAQTAGATFVALFTIIVTTVLVRTLGQAAGGTVDNAEVFMLILLGGLQYLPAALVITVFIAVMGVVSRAFKEQEMTAWFASGLSLHSLIRPVIRFAIPLTVLALACSVWLTPWAKAELDAAKDRFAKRSDVSKVSAGQFRESGDANRVFFVERQSELTKQVENVFVVDAKGENRTIVSASRGKVEIDADGQPYLVLSEGRRFALDGTGKRFTSTEFETYGVAIDNTLGAAPSYQLQHRRVDYLIADTSLPARAELLWRISLPLSALVLGLLAIPLAFVNPRGGQSLNQVFALLIYLTYSNVVSVTQSMVSKGKLDFWLALALPHLAVLLLFWFLLVRRNRPAGAAWFRRPASAKLQLDDVVGNQEIKP